MHPQKRDTYKGDLHSCRRPHEAGSYVAARQVRAGIESTAPRQSVLRRVDRGVSWSAKVIDRTEFEAFKKSSCRCLIQKLGKFFHLLYLLCTQR